MTFGICEIGKKLRRSSPNSPSKTPSAEKTFSGSLGRYSVRLEIDGHRQGDPDQDSDQQRQRRQQRNGPTQRTHDPQGPSRNAMVEAQNKERRCRHVARQR
jgi:hypothetical protein